jgi:arsenate reductase-like glutaredoxin family protein
MAEGPEERRMDGTDISRETMERAAHKLNEFLNSLSDEERVALDAALATAMASSPMAVWPPDRIAPPGTPKVTIYSLPGCGACHEAEEFLRVRGVEVTVRDVSADRQAAQDLVKVRRNASDAVGAFPLIVAGDNVIVGYSPVKLRDALLPVAAADPQE